MFDLIPKFLSSIASFLFPLFASYKALKTSDPTQLTPWLMYWSVLSCALLAESWLEFILWWIPFYSYLRLFFLLYLVLPQTQGARYLYETYLHPYLEENETQIEEFIASAHDRLRTAGMAYLRQAIELVKTKMLGMPPSEPSAEEVRAKAAPQGYTQALLARFSVPATRWTSQSAGNAGTEFYNLLAGAVSAATGASALASAGGSSSGGATRSLTGAGAADPMSASGTLIPDNIRGSQEKISFIASQRERLAFVLNALDREAKALQRGEQERQNDDRGKPASMSLDGSDGNNNNGGNNLERPPSGHSVWSALSKSRSEVDFEKIEAESASEEDENGLRRRAEASTPGSNGGRAGWSFLGWGTVGGGGSTGAATSANDSPTRGQSSGVEQP
ncbi:hypothetical protein PG989_014362 [Apiospora arundinis]